MQNYLKKVCIDKTLKCQSKPQYIDAIPQSGGGKVGEYLVSFIIDKSDETNQKE